MAYNLEIEICKFHQYGYCKFGAECPKFHTEDICKEFPCQNDNCSSRHPKNCNFIPPLENVSLEMIVPICTQITVFYKSK